MIFDQIKNYARYTKTDENIKAALEFIDLHKDNKEILDGKYEIIPDQVTAYVVSKDTILAEDAEMEIHKKFMDIHYMLKGQESCGLTELSMDVQEAAYDDAGDISLFSAEDTNVVVVSEGEFYAVWPYEPHRPLCNVQGTSRKIRKIICKVKV
ncbi:YhcH/YjgK/YiaL family protein [Anaerobium acetethylicum]|uniref:YhcH/YjgK/YiaL family protein n=1 Tax=Anaerobium acetethylicum TaxID=1619234 RepID=A0A1D3TVT9_9FIRM|nr:YhcH/YjgK/YiaL family protein [Anaerobium acetethylicum]SCP98272.1 YhcH/YjgK/YiaL family protein [Anaerobium acetethylicum]